MKYLLMIYCLLSSIYLFSQKEDNIWMLGYANEWHNDSNYQFVGNTSLNFSYNPLAAQWISDCLMDFNEASASICDKNGNLLLYTNGVVVANMEHDTIENGTGLNPGWYTDNYASSGSGIMQAAIILPYPEHKDLYYIIHYSPEENNGNFACPRKLLCSLVDMSINNGKGKVVEKNVVVLQDTLSLGAITACRHANGRDWWLMMPESQGGNCYYRILLSPNGLEVLDKQCIGVVNWAENWQAQFSPNGKKFAVHEIDRIKIFDFDRCTGMFSNPDTIGIPHNSSWWWLGGLAFAPNSKYLYFSSELFVYQLDTDASDVAASMQLVAEYDTIKVEVPPGSGVWLPVPFWFMGLAPNGKIYIVPPNAAQVMHVIEEPDLPGLACNLVQRGQPLPTINAYTIPNFPNFRLGAAVGSGCDTLVSKEEGIRSEVNIYPNPAATEIYIEGAEIGTNGGLYNLLGQEITLFRIEKEQFTLSVADIPTGIYILHLSFQDKIWKQKIVIQR